MSERGKRYPIIVIRQNKQQKFQLLRYYIYVPNETHGIIIS